MKSKRKGKFKTLIWFEILFKSTYLMLMYQICRFALTWLLKVNGFSYLTFENMRYFFKNPITIITLLIIVFTAVFLYLIETVSLLVFYQDYIKGKRIQVIQIFVPGVRRTFQILKRSFFGVMLFAVMNALIVLFPLIYVAANRLQLPGYLAGVALKNEIIFWIVLAIALLFVVLQMFGACTLYYMVLGEYGFWKAYRKSAHIVRTNFGYFAARVIAVNIVIVVIGALLFGGLMLGAGFLIYRTRIDTLRYVTMLNVYDNLFFYFGILLTICSQLANYTILSSFFNRFGMRLFKINEIEKMQEQMIYEDAVWQLLDYSSGKWIMRQMYGVYSRLAVLIAVIVLGINVYSIYDSIKNGVISDRETLRGTYITAHRGSSKNAPENTLLALENAIDEMADYAEIDLQLTKDGQIIVMHDGSLKRTAGLNKLVSETDFDTIRSLDVGRWFGKDFVGTQIPTFEEVIEVCKGKIHLNIELKSEKDSARNRQLVEETMALIDEYDLYNQCVITSTDLNMLRYVKEYGDVKTGYIVSFAYGDFYHIDEIDFISIRYNLVNGTLVENLHSMGKEIHVWTVNSKNIAERMKKIGVDNIITDRPVMIQNVIWDDHYANGFIRLIQDVFE